MSTGTLDLQHRRSETTVHSRPPTWNRHARRAAKHRRLLRRRPSPPSPPPPSPSPTIAPVLVESPKARARREAREMKSLLADLTVSDEAHILRAESERSASPESSTS
jgi:hypothetical protein